MKIPDESNVIANFPVNNPNRENAGEYLEYVKRFHEENPEANEELGRLKTEKNLKVVFSDKARLDERLGCSNCGQDVSNSFYAHMYFEGDSGPEPVICTDCLENIHTEDVKPGELIKELHEEHGGPRAE